jgi:phage DNA polymerase|nr:MAG TPA: DNA polymerase [Caudoviricetes sp.]
MRRDIVGFYDFEVFMCDWLVVIISSQDELIVIHNDPELLKKTMNNINCLIGFNNYNYDDLVLAGIISKNMTPYEVYKLSQSIINGEKNTFYKNIAKKLPTFDTKQELQLGISLKEIESNMGMNIVETPVSFDLDRPLTTNEFGEVIKYCIHDVETTKKIFEYRKDYFESKIDICKEFNLDMLDVKKTRANLASKVLQCNKSRLPTQAKLNRDRLLFTITDKLRKENIPQPILDFYMDIQNRFIAGEDFKKLEEEKLIFNLCGVEHTYAFGGLHAARPNFHYEGDMLLVDVGSYYPSMIINFNFMSRASEHPELYKNLYRTRMKYKKEKDPKQGIYKILLNSTFGALKSEFNDLYDPVQSNNICINGQLLLTDLIISLKDYTKIIQSNTDGILVAYKKQDLPKIIEICEAWEKNYNLSLDYDYAVKIAQRDVNNYILKVKNGDGYKIKGKGLFQNYNGGNYEKNNLTIIDMALKAFYMDDIPIDRFILSLIKENNLLPFQQVAKMGGTFHHVETVVNGEEKVLQKVNRIFATWKKEYGPIHKIKLIDDIKKYNKIPNSSDRVYIHNDEIEKLDKNILDLDYYRKLVEKNKFTNKKVVSWELFDQST